MPDLCTNPINPACTFELAKTVGGAAVSNGVSNVAASAFDSMVNSLKEGVGSAVGIMMSFWMNIPIPQIGADGGSVEKIHSATLYLTVITGVVSLFFVVGKAVLAHSSASSEETRNAAQGLVRLVIASVVAVPAVVLANQGVDAYSRWLVEQAANGDVGAAVGKLMSFDLVTGNGIGSGFVFIMAIFALIASIVQAFLIIIRDAMLIVLVGTLPLAAAASITGSGRETWNKAVGWLISFTLFKLAAGIIYATALYSVSNASDVMGQVAGVFLVILAVFTLPALMRLISPQVAKVGSGGGGVGMLAAAGTVATGAATISATRNNGGGGAGAARGGSGAASFKGEPGASGATSQAGARHAAGAGGKAAAGPVGGAVAVMEKAHGAITSGAEDGADGGGGGQRA